MNHTPLQQIGGKIPLYILGIFNVLILFNMSNPTIYELHDALFNEERCVEYIRAQGIFYRNRECPQCNGQMALMHAREKFRCPKKNCRREESERKGSFFFGLRLPLNQILFLAYLWTNKIPPTVMKSMTGIAIQTVVDMRKYFRQLVGAHLEDLHDQIGGEGIVVELDESKLGKRKYHRGHRVDGVWVLGGVERTTAKRAFMVTVPDRTAQTLQNIILQHVRPGSTIHTDLWRGYFGLGAIQGLDGHALFTHLTVNHSLFFRDPETNVHTNTIEGLWNGLKICITPRGRCQDGMNERLTEFLWRRQHVGREWLAMLKALKEVHYDD